MPRVHESREELGSELNRLTAQAAAIDSQLELNRNQALKGVTLKQRELHEAMGKFERQIQDQKARTEATTSKALAAINRLRVQLALRKARDAQEVDASETDALELQFSEKKAETLARLAQQKEDLVAKINAFKADIQGKGKLMREKGTAFEAEIATRTQTIREAFAKLFSQAADSAHAKRTAPKGPTLRLIRRN
jgi:hypothetical protein